MSDLFQLLGGHPFGTNVESGVIVTALTDGKFTVNIRGGGEYTVESAIPATSLLPGMRVVLSKIENSRYIVGASRQYISNKVKEVVING